MSEKESALTRVTADFQKAQVKQRILSVCQYAKEIVFIRQDLLQTSQAELRSAQVENSLLRH